MMNIHAVLLQCQPRTSAVLAQCLCRNAPVPMQLRCSRDAVAVLTRYKHLQCGEQTVFAVLTRYKHLQCGEQTVKLQSCASAGQVRAQSMRCQCRNGTVRSVRRHKWPSAGQ